MELNLVENTDIKINRKTLISFFFLYFICFIFNLNIALANINSHIGLNIEVLNIFFDNFFILLNKNIPIFSILYILYLFSYPILVKYILKLIDKNSLVDSENNITKRYWDLLVPIFNIYLSFKLSYYIIYKLFKHKIFAFLFATTTSIYLLGIHLDVIETISNGEIYTIFPLVSIINKSIFDFNSLIFHLIIMFITIKLIKKI